MLRTKKLKTTTTKGKPTAGKPSKLPIPRRFPVGGGDPAKPAKESREPAQPPKAAAVVAQGQQEAVPAAPAPATPAAADPTPGKRSCLDAAAEVLKASGTPMRCKELVAAMADKGLWTSTAPTPHQTLASALLREVTRKGADSRFRKARRGEFALNVTA